MCHTRVAVRTLSDAISNGQKINGKVGFMSFHTWVVCVGIVYPIKYLSLLLHYTTCAH